jgi:hypothetical protein
MQQKRSRTYLMFLTIGSFYIQHNNVRILAYRDPNSFGRCPPKIIIYKTTKDSNNFSTTSWVPSMDHSKTNKDSSKTTINLSYIYINLPPFCLLVQCLKLSFKHGIHQSTLPCSINKTVSHSHEYLKSKHCLIQEFELWKEKKREVYIPLLWAPIMDTTL